MKIRGGASFDVAMNASRVPSGEKAIVVVSMCEMREPNRAPDGGGFGVSQFVQVAQHQRLAIQHRQRDDKPMDEIDEITVQHEEASAIRLLLAAKDPASVELAGRWAQEWVDKLESRRRPRALLPARSTASVYTWSGARNTGAQCLKAESPTGSAA